MTASTPRPITVLVVDDHPMLREGVAAVLDLQDDMRLVGEAESGAAGVARFRELRPDVTLMDLQIPDITGAQGIETIRTEAPHAKIVFLTTYAGDVRARRALKAGAAVY